MLTQKKIVLFILLSAVQFQTLFSQIVLQGTVTDNGAEYLGNGAEPVVNALVTVTDQADSCCSFTSYTNEQGQYAIQITLTGVDDVVSAKPGDFRLLQNCPNPFNPSTVIRYELSQPSHVTIQVYSILGRKLKVLIDGFRSSSGQVVWDGTDGEGTGLPAGVYFYSLDVDGNRLVRKMTLVDGHPTYRSMKPANPAASETLGKNGLNKQASHLYIMQIICENIDTYEQRDITITGNLVLDVSVNRTVTDIDGNIYRTVKIGAQWWMAENLKVTHYSNGEAISSVTDSSAWANLTTGACCVYDNNPTNASVYGLLYNWHAVNDSRNIAPAGWHVPSDEEWKQLEMVLGMSRSEADDIGWRGTNEGSKLAGNASLWTNGALENNSEFGASGFSALPGGYRYRYGSYYLVGIYACFWSSTVGSSYFAWSRYLYDDYSEVYRSISTKLYGYSIRCVRD